MHDDRRLDARDAGFGHLPPRRGERAIEVDRARGVFDHGRVEAGAARVERRPGDAEVGGEAAAVDLGDAARLQITGQAGAGAGLVLGVPRQHFFDLLEPMVAEAVAAALGQFESLGARLEAVDLPLASELAEASRTIVAVESYAAHRESLGVRGHLYSERPRRSIEHGAACTPEQYAAAQVLRARWTEQVQGVLARVDALVTPTMSTAPYPVAVWLNNDTERMGPGMTYHFNLARLPALTLPCGFSPAGHPLGLQLVGRAFDEATLFRIAHAYEQSAGWYRRRPPRYA